MSDRREAFLLICLLSLARIGAVTASPPDCGDCMYWDGDSCEMVGECVDWWDCPNGGWCCDCVDCWCEDDIYWCSTCELCEECECICVRVISVSGPSGHYCVGDSRSVTAVTDHSLPAGCSIIWTAWPAGVVSFSNPSDYSVTATFIDSGQYVQIGAHTSCMGYGRWTSPFDVVELDVVVPPPDTAELCEDVVFHAFTQPTGYQEDVVWSAPQGDPNSAKGSSFTTHWRCRGSYEVSASYCGDTLYEYVDVNIPSGCREGTETVLLRYNRVDSNDCPDCNSTICGCWDFASGLSGGGTPVYDGNSCEWVWDVNTVTDVQYGICSDSFRNVCSIEDIPVNDRTEQNLTYIIGILRTGGCASQGAGEVINCDECTMKHEAVHHAVFKKAMAYNLQKFLDGPAMAPIPVDCADPNSITCSTVDTKYWPALLQAIEDYYLAAHTAAMNAEPDAQAASYACSNDVADSLCAYACAQG